MRRVAFPLFLSPPLSLSHSLCLFLSAYLSLPLSFSSSSSCPFRLAELISTDCDFSRCVLFRLQKEITKAGSVLLSPLNNCPVDLFIKDFRFGIAMLI